MSQEYKIYPEDVSSNKAIGIKLPFNRDTYNRSRMSVYNSDPSRDVGPFELSYTTEEQAISNLINLLFTRRGERVMHPDFGTILRDFLFDQNDEVNRIILEDDIREAIQYWLPYILVRSLDIGYADQTELPTNETLHSVVISLSFSVYESGANRTIKIYITESGDIQTELL